MWFGSDGQTDGTICFLLRTRSLSGFALEKKFLCGTLITVSSCFYFLGWCEESVATVVILFSVFYSRRVIVTEWICWYSVCRLILEAYL